jgi:hypothetical protein
MTPEEALQDPHLADLYGQIAAIKDHARQVTGGLDEEQLNWRPARGAWSIGQCLEHLIITADLYYERMGQALQMQGKSTGERMPWHPSLLGRMLIKSVTTSRRLKRPSKFRPPRQARDGLLETFLQSQDRLADLMRQADGLDLTRIKVSSPVGRLLRLNLGDCFTVLVLHSKRHLRQAARVAESRRLPGHEPEAGHSKGS